MAHNVYTEIWQVRRALAERGFAPLIVCSADHQLYLLTGNTEQIVAKPIDAPTSPGEPIANKPNTWWPIQRLIPDHR